MPTEDKSTPRRKLTMTPEKLAASNTEDGHQKAVIQHCRAELVYDYPEIKLMYHVPNGGQRGDARSASITMANLKSMGLVEGVPDLCLPLSRCGYSSLYIEMKRPDGKGSLESSQFDYIVLLCNNGAIVAIVDDWRDAIQVLELYLEGNEETIKLLTTTKNEEIPDKTLIDVNDYFGKEKRRRLRADAKINKQL